MNSRDSDVLAIRLQQIIFVLGPGVTLFVNPWSNFDPISLPKMVVLTTLAFSQLAVVILLGALKYESLKFLRLFCFGFLFFMFLTFLFSGSPLSQQFWGVFGRNTGFLTYFSLLIILYSVSCIVDRIFFKRILNSLVFTSILVVAYSIVQYFKLDPILWSEQGMFSTLGNINFLSAFLGLSSVAVVGLATLDHLGALKRTTFLSLALIQMIVVWETGSIQGIMMFFAGGYVLLLLYFISTRKIVRALIPYCVFGLASLTLVILGLLNKGILARILFQPSVVFRGDYMHAGLQMTLDHPLNGVGMDAYGDWYRESRGEISTLRDNPDRIANTAHNIFLDISSNGGIPLLVAYLLILFTVFYHSIKFLKRNKNFDPIFSTMFSVWIAYQVQATISINQIGVGVWGWILSGSLIAYEISTREASGPTKRILVQGKKRSGLMLSAPKALLVLSFTFLGFLLNLAPLRADMAFRSALKIGSIDKALEASEMFGSSSWHGTMVLDSAVKENNADVAKRVIARMTAKYPREFYGWRILAISSFATSEEREKAIRELRKLDPFNPMLR
jgi:O-antigen ligase